MAGETVLLIDESTARADLFRRQLTGAGYQVLVAQNAVAPFCLPEGTELDVVLAQADLSGDGGREVVARLRGDRRAWRAAIGLLIPEETLRAGEGESLSGAMDYLVVPCSAETLVRKVGELARAAAAQREADARAREMITRYVEETLATSFRRLLEEKAQEMVEDLAAGIAEVLEARAREAMRSRLEEAINEESRQRLAELVRETGLSVFGEVAEEAVSRVASGIVEAKSDEVARRMEEEDLPELVGRLVERELEGRMNEFTSRIIVSAGKDIVAKVGQETAANVKKVAERTFPEVAERLLPGLVTPMVRRLVKESK